MNQLKKSIMGKYNADDVDRLLSAVRKDYEQCLREQKDRILTLRDENKELAATLAQYRENEQYIIGAITRAEETAEAIIRDAQNKAKEIMSRAERDKLVIQTAASGCYERLCNLRDISHEIYQAVSKAVGEHDDRIRPASNLRPFVGHYESSQI